MFDVESFQEYVNKEGWVAFFNRSDKGQTIDVSWKFSSFMPNGTYNLKDIWGNQSVTNYKKGDKLSIKIPENGVVFLKYSQVQL